MAQHLHQLSCSVDEVAKFDGANWVCAEYTGTNNGVFPPQTERFTDNGDETITDNQTGLMWEKKLAADGTDGGNCTDSIQAYRDVRCVNNLYSWTDLADGDDTNADGMAFTELLSTLNQKATDDPESSCFANHCDWRVPRLVELRSIVFEQYPCSTSPCIDGIFGPTAANFYWSSSTFAAVPTGAWGVLFSDGFIDAGNKLNSFHVRAVRGRR